jgi:hypothetical protein
MKYTFHLDAPRKNWAKPIQYAINEKGCWHCVSHTGIQSGYVQVRIEGKLELLHRLSYEQHKGPIPKGMEILHSCDNPKCFNPEHLEYGTKQENLKDRDLKGRQAKGEQNGRAKLKTHEVRQIRKDRRSNRMIALEYGVTALTIRRVKSLKTWVHLKEEAE